ncbi:hypothetical protein [Dysgonomonas sp. GY617]|uniref:hypothetical protein n=1 Tax=Dysgonomonas sp. GY617 TaxID=2780420 RepID=UPI0018844267|nr:hypothetical protein [Dysgonomonas sp. GY617]MBF0574929.1 hypothetical protein [Dysgonomonas sp. GY617]
MRKIALSLVMSCALLASTAVMAQDAKATKADKPKTEETKSCCSAKKDTDKKGTCTAKTDKKEAASTPKKK